MDTGDIVRIVVWVLLGILVGWIASLVVPGADGILTYFIAGVLGSIIGGFLARGFNIRLRLGNAFLEQMLISVLGAILVLVVWQIVT